MIRQFQGAYRPFSNFWILDMPVYINQFIAGYDNGIGYRSVEHAFQAAKSLDMNDRTAISRISKPIEAKHYGYTIQLRADWDTIKIPLMADLVQQKFDNSPKLRTLLLSTGTAELYEGNTWNDTFWGVDLTTMRGENHLGRILMAIRASYQRGSYQK